MRALAVDASTWWGSVALVEQQEGRPTLVVAEHSEFVRDSHAGRILPWIERLLADAGWARTSIDIYAAARGPGSFTGIRVALGTVTGLALGAGRRAIGVGTLQALAEAYGPAAAERIAVLDAGRGEVYAARYDAGSSPPVELAGPTVEALGLLLARSPHEAVILPGPGTDLGPFGARGPRSCDPSRLLASAVGRLALARPATDDESLAPLYVRQPDAWIRHGAG